MKITSYLKLATVKALRYSVFTAFSSAIIYAHYVKNETELKENYNNFTCSSKINNSFYCDIDLKRDFNKVLSSSKQHLNIVFNTYLDDGGVNNMADPLGCNPISIEFEEYSNPKGCILIEARKLEKEYKKNGELDSMADYKALSHYMAYKYKIWQEKEAKKLELRKQKEYQYKIMLREIIELKKRGQLIDPELISILKEAEQAKDSRKQLNHTKLQ